MSMSKVAVIIPFYNQKLEYITQAVDSVLTQTLRDIEVILVDDGSANPNQYRNLTKDSRVKMFKNHKSGGKGAGYARNIGILNSSSENIMFLDSDDFYPENTVIERLYTLKNENNVLVAGGKHLVLKNDNKLHIVDYRHELLEGYYTNRVVDYMDYQDQYFFWRFLYDSELIKRNNLFFPFFYRSEDPIWFIKTMCIAKRFYAANMVSLIHRDNDNGNTMCLKQIRRFIPGVLAALKYAKSHNLNSLYNFKKNEIMYWDVPVYRNVVGVSEQEVQDFINTVRLIDTTKLI